jgi:hypothetical protein
MTLAAAGNQFPTIPGSDPSQGGSGAVDQQKAALQAMVQQMLKQATQPRAGMPAPQPRYGEDEMKQQGYNMSPAYGKTANIGIGLQNAGTFINNMVAKHKQNQVRDALSDWQNYDNAIEKAQMVAGDPNATGFKEKFEDALSKQPWVQSNLDPSNPKNLKRLKNMYKGLNIDLFDDKENVHSEGLKRHIKVKAAEKGIKDAAQQKQMAQQMQEVFKGRVQKLADMAKMQQPDPKNLESAAKLVESQLAHEDVLEWHKMQIEEADKRMKEQDAMLDKRLKGADERQDKALKTAADRQDASLLAHTTMMMESWNRMDERQQKRLDAMNQTKGYNINTQGKAQKMDLAQGADVPATWISEKDAEAIATPTVQGRNRAEASRVVSALLPEIDKMVSLDNKKLGAISGRVSDFAAGKIGENDPAYIYLKQLSELAKSGTAMMHLGLRGAASVQSNANKFLDAFNTGKMSPDNIRAGIRAVKLLTKEYAEEGNVAPIGSPEWNKRYKEATNAVDSQADSEIHFTPSN